MAAATSDLALRYEQDGFVTVDGLIDSKGVDVLRDRIEAIADGTVPEFPTENIESEPRAEGSAKPLPRKINRCAEDDTVFMSLAHDRRILDIVEQLIGCDIKLYGSQCFMKPPGGVEKPYHQDSAYFTIEPQALVTCWLALDDVTLENGCLWVVPGSHQGDVIEHSQPWQLGDRTDMQVPEDRIERSREQPITMSAGSCSFHHSKLLHRSGPNKSNRSRRGMAIHYMSSRSRWTHPSKPQPTYLLVRGTEYDGCV